MKNVYTTKQVVIDFLPRDKFLESFFNLYKIDVFQLYNERIRYRRNGTTMTIYETFITGEYGARFEVIVQDDLYKLEKTVEEYK